jgi:hypothetical protein
MAPLSEIVSFLSSMDCTIFYLFRETSPELILFSFMRVFPATGRGNLLTARF